MVTYDIHCNESEFSKAVRVDGLLAYNQKITGGALMQPGESFCLVARDETGRILGGVSGSTYLMCLEVDVLWVDDACRGKGIGGELLRRIEDWARELGCLLSHLGTYSFQGPAFYTKQGYTQVGEVTGFAKGISLCYFKKDLTN